MTDHPERPERAMTPFRLFDTQRLAAEDLPDQNETLIPAAPKMPTNTDVSEARETSPAAADKDQANWDMIRSALAGMSGVLASLERKSDAQQVTLDELNQRIGAIDSLLIARFDEVESGLNDLKTLVARLNEITAGVRHAADSALDVATSTAREVREVRRSSIPDHGPATTLKAVPGSKHEGG